MSKNTRVPPTATATVALPRLAAAFAFLTVAMGAVVCATNAGAACPTWPGCHPDQITPGWAASPVIEFTHRVVAFATGPLLLAAAVASTRHRRVDRWLRVLPWLAVAAAVVSATFGRLVVLSGISASLGAIDLFCALTAMILIGVVAVTVRDPAAAGTEAAGHPGASEPPGRSRTAHRLAAASVAVLLTTHVTGVLAAGPGSYTRCVGWPLWWRVPDDPYHWLQSLRLGLGGLGALLILTAAAAAVRRRRSRPWGTALATLLVAELVLGATIRARGPRPDGVAAAYSVLAVAILWCVSLLMARTRPIRTASALAPGGDPSRRAEPVSGLAPSGGGTGPG